MLALFRSRCPLTSTPLRQTRSIRSSPREIPTHVLRWNPTLHKSARTPRPPIEPGSIGNAALDDVSRTEERTKLRDTQRLSKPYEGFNHDTRYVESSHGQKDHLAELAHDIHSVGATTIGQRVRFLENLFLGGKEEEALKAWEGDHNQINPELRHDYKPEHLEIGAKLYALAGNAERAAKIMEELFRLYPDWSPFVMMNVFRAYTSSELETDYDAAKEIYVRMRDRMGTDMTIRTYDACLVGFLEARCLPHAKRVFRDMCKDGYLVTSGDQGDVEKVLRRLHLLYQLGTDISKMTSIALDAISTLPASYHSQIFGDWMKCAVVERAPEAGAQILDMMLQRGCEPETFHFNLLLRALLRTDETSNSLKAENIGWRMIEKARLAAIAMEHIPAGPAHHIAMKLSDNDLVNHKPQFATDLEADTTMVVPCASATTFGIIMQHHAKGQQWEHVDYLARQLREAGAKPNTAIMNVLIESKCRQGRFSEAWIIYKSLTDNPDAQNIFPDGATHRLLWITLRYALDQHASQVYSNLPTPRAFLAETVNWWMMCRSRYDAQRFLQGLAGPDHSAITSLILHCFSYARDLPGSLVALHVLRHKFDIYPTDKVLEILQRQMAWVELRDGSERLQAKTFSNEISKRNLRDAELLFQQVLAKRMKRMDISSDDYFNLGDEEIGEMSLNLMSELVRVWLKKEHPPAVVEAMIDAAKDEVGVPDVPTGDMDASQIPDYL
jgi:hypothetical protein